MRARGLMSPSADVRVEPMAGGVSCEVFAVSGEDRELVVKRAEGFLRVADSWPAPPRRASHEGDVLGVLSLLTPEVVPGLVDNDREACTIAITRAPATWRMWKEHLLEGRTDAAVAARLGDTLGTWHQATWGSASAHEADDYELFELLRLEPYFVTAAGRCPRHAEALEAVLTRLRSRRLCLVHGDFSPKNVLVGDDGLWVLDFEVGHLGDPEFDLAFLLHHLVLKAVHRPAEISGYQECARMFLSSYRATGPSDGGEGDRGLSRLLGALLLARVHGKSPAEYLTDQGHEHTERLAGSLLHEPVDRIDDAWHRAQEELG